MLSFENQITYEFASQNSNIRLQGPAIETSSGHSLELYHYMTNVETTTEEKQYRGVVFDIAPDGSTTKHIFFPHTKEFVVNRENFTKVTELLNDVSPADVKVYNANEASCLLRVFNSDGKWYITTHHRMDADKSHWECDKSFREQFEDSLFWNYTNKATNTVVNPPSKNYTKLANERVSSVELVPSPFWETLFEETAGSLDRSQVLEKFLESLDISLDYTFIVCPTVENNNRFVAPGCLHPTVINSGVFHDGVLHYTEVVDGIANTEEIIIGDLSTTTLFDYVSGLDAFSQGVMVFTPTVHFKLVNEGYHYNRELRGNNNILFRYIDLALKCVTDDDSSEYFKNYKNLYPTHEQTFNKCDMAIEDIVIQIGKAYFRQHAPDSRDNRRIFPSEYKLMQSLHNWHKAERFNKNGRRHNKVYIPGYIKDDPRSKMEIINMFIEHYNSQENTEDIPVNYTFLSDISNELFEKSRPNKNAGAPTKPNRKYNKFNGSRDVINMFIERYNSTRDDQLVVSPEIFASFFSSLIENLKSVSRSRIMHNTGFLYDEEFDTFIHINEIYMKIYEMPTLFVYKMVKSRQTHGEKWTIYDTKPSRFENNAGGKSKPDTKHPFITNLRARKTKSDEELVGSTVEMLDVPIQAPEPQL
ncbi:MAG: hypothetical protein JKX76_01665 [Colwellia sp.]|nr:hypothetical protein [Colwellia sp.]